MATHDGQARTTANDALNDLAVAKSRLAARLVTPWWYKAASGLVIAAGILGIGMTFDNFPFGGPSLGTGLVAAAVVSGPLMLHLLKRATGAAIDRYGNAWTGVTFVGIGVLVVALMAQWLLDWGWALVVAAILAFVMTVAFEVRVDARLRRGNFPNQNAA